MSEILVTVSSGEFLDKIATLEIKCERIRDEGKLANVRREVDALNDTWAGEFGDGLVRLARAVPVANEERARVRKDINLKRGSACVEEQPYSDYGPTA
jgi:hypothetical protein